MSLVEIAKIGAPHGIKGHVKLKIFLEDISLLKKLKPLQFHDGEIVEIGNVKQQGKAHIAFIKDVNNRNKAENLKNKVIYAENSLLPAPEEEEFYYSDLIGLEVRNEIDEKIGTVKNVMDFGAGDIIEILYSDSKKTELFPFTNKIIPIINVVDNYIIISQPDIHEVIDTEEKPSD